MAEWKNSNLSSNTIVLRLTVVRTYLNWLNSNSKCNVEDIPEMIAITRSVKLQQKIQEYATEEVTKATIAALKKSSHKAIVGLMYYSALRVSEAIGLTVDCLKDDGFIVKDPKNKCDRYIPYLSKELNKLLDDHIQRTRPTNKLFPDVTQNAFQRTLKRALENIGCPKLHAHSFRHGMVTKFLEKDIDVATIASITGHKSLSSLQRYFHVSNTMLEKTKDVFK